MHYLGEKVLVDCCNIVGLVEHKFVMPVHIHTLSVVTFLSHGMVVQIVEKPIEGVGVSLPHFTLSMAVRKRFLAYMNSLKESWWLSFAFLDAASKPAGHMVT